MTLRPRPPQRIPPFPRGVNSGWVGFERPTEIEHDSADTGPTALILRRGCRSCPVDCQAGSGTHGPPVSPRRFHHMPLMKTLVFFTRENELVELPWISRIPSAQRARRASARLRQAKGKGLPHGRTRTHSQASMHRHARAPAARAHVRVHAHIPTHTQHTVRTHTHHPPTTTHPHTNPPTHPPTQT